MKKKVKGTNKRLIEKSKNLNFNYQTDLQSKRVFHYTVQQHALKIMETGLIKPNNLNNLSNLSNPEDFYVWFTTSENWEKTANKGFHYDSAGNIVYGDVRDTEKLGMIRIEIDPVFPLMSWEQFKKDSGIPRKEARALERLGENPYEWLVTRTPVSVNDYLIAVELWYSGKWINFMDLENGE